jgi:hypothetical protein
LRRLKRSRKFNSEWQSNSIYSFSINNTTVTAKAKLTLPTSTPQLLLRSIDQLVFI